ncbi:MAG: MazG nucleotide pyrophosphohydrolase domain-containing protein [Candidatus Woesearchaeota archaeon]
MDFVFAQKEVSDWIGQFKISYFAPNQIITQLFEETGELASAIAINDLGGVEEELCDVVFGLICMANSHNIALKNNYVCSLKSGDVFLNLSSSLGGLAREISHMYGPKKKKYYELKSSLSERLDSSFSAVLCFANHYNLSLDNAFSVNMDKLYGRDNNRWEKK